MKNYILLLALSFCAFQGFSQTDSAKYEAQRNKINELLDDRSAKFGQYDESLSKRTGIFGLKTKKDMQRSIDILTEIAKTDNNILQETKILLDYKDFEKAQVQTEVVETKGNIGSFMITIKKLQDQNDKLNAQVNEFEKSSSNLSYFVVILSIALIAALYFLYKRR